MPSMWRRMSMVSILVCGGAKSQQVFCWIVIIYLPLRLPNFLSMFGPDVGKHVHQQAANRQQHPNSFWLCCPFPWNLEVTENELGFGVGASGSKSAVKH